MTSLSTFTFDTIVKNESTQDAVSVVAIIEFVLERIRIDLPEIRKIWVMTDNATCYSNAIIPVFLPLLGRNREIDVKGCMQSRTQRVKAFLGAHFAVAMRQVKRYVNEEGKCVTTPRDIVQAMEWNGAIVNSRADLASGQCSHPSKMAWVEARKHFSLARVRRLNKIAYEAVSTVHSQCVHLHWKVPYCVLDGTSDVPCCSTRIFC